jgi:hypothetical protein
MVVAKTGIYIHPKTHFLKVVISGAVLVGAIAIRPIGYGNVLNKAQHYEGGRLQKALRLARQARWSQWRNTDGQ